jgi:hypothetical protein
MLEIEALRIYTCVLTVVVGLQATRSGCLSSVCVFSGRRYGRDM